MTHSVAHVVLDLLAMVFWTDLPSALRYSAKCWNTLTSGLIIHHNMSLLGSATGIHLIVDVNTKGVETVGLYDGTQCIHRSSCENINELKPFTV
ncbi:hypothetical protein AHF37_07423 [Paragonimus kellicotti]|nr:hypothetical protein AHF37_07423 [Paragonimus kellicotti]